MDDILIRGGQVIDGTGAPARAADVAIRAGRIVAIEADRADSAGRVIDAHGCVVAPGFIDIHTHSDFTLPLNPRAEAKIRQADVVLFDPATIIDRSSYDDPHQYPAGIGTVIVNGTVVIDGGEHTGALPGRLLRRRGTVLA